MTSGIDFAGISDRGRVRPRNEDRWFADAELGLFIVADGLGGGPHGEIAAEIVVKTLPELLRKKLRDIADDATEQVRSLVESAVVELSQRLRHETRHQPGLAGMGSTVVLLLVHGRQAVVAHLGDSRAYLFRERELELLTSDHSLVQTLLSHDQLSPDEIVGIESHPSRGQLTRYVGMEGHPLPNMQVFEMHAGDKILLCSDGLSGTVNGETLSQILNNQDSCHTTLRHLLTAANEAGGPDNITAVLVEFNANRWTADRVE